MSLIEKIGLALCQNALGGKKCPCAETGKFQCANEYPGHQAQAALTAIMDAGDGVQEVDVDAASDLFAQSPRPSGVSFAKALSRHRSTAAAAERARIVAAIRLCELSSAIPDDPAQIISDLADAIERGEV